MGLACSPRWLAKLAVIGGGPIFRKAGRTPIYARADLDRMGAGPHRRAAEIDFRQGVRRKPWGSAIRNYRLAKRHRNYTVEEIAELFGKHENTVRGWLKSGLETIDKARPALVHGQTLASFLEARRSAGKRLVPPGHCIA